MVVDSADAVVEGTLAWSFLTADDLTELAGLREAIDYFDDPVEPRELDTMARDFQRDSKLDGYLATVGRDKGGTIIAYAWIHPAVSSNLSGHLYLETGVHPAARHRQIGRRLIEWAVHRAQDWHDAKGEGAPPLWLGYLVDEKFTGLCAALVREGFVPQRWYFDAHARFGDHPLPPVPDIPGVRLVHYDASLSEPVRLAHNAVFGVLPGASEFSRADWEWSLGETGDRPEWSWVALPQDGDMVLGYAMNTAYVGEGPEGESEGWTARFGVRQAWRMRGIGTALILASMHSFRDAGLDGAGLGVDTGVPEATGRLLDRCGFESQERVVLYARGGAGTM